jgi:DNA-nicking Smr family endonuclease
VKRRPGQGDSDADEFARAMAGVRRVAPDPRGRVQVVPVTTRRAPAAASPSTSTSKPPIAHDDDEDSASGFVTPGVDRRQLRKLKRGDHIPGARIDLHGMTAVEAIAGVTRFIEKSRHLHRCVCIVHGRGLHSGGSIAILKTRVRAFLRAHRGVLAYSDAPRNDGGPGAVYVLLRK